VECAGLTGASGRRHCAVGGSPIEVRGQRDDASPRNFDPPWTRSGLVRHRRCTAAQRGGLAAFDLGDPTLGGARAVGDLPLGQAADAADLGEAVSDDLGEHLAVRRYRRAEQLAVLGPRSAVGATPPRVVWLTSVSERKVNPHAAELRLCSWKKLAGCKLPGQPLDDVSEGGLAH
jgi:hypothetical protein